MRLIAIPNWSFGRDRDLLRKMVDALEELPLNIHFAESDVDHNRTVTGYSGDAGDVIEGTLELARLAFDRIDLNRHIGVHPRIGALDVCPIVPMPGGTMEPAIVVADEIARRIASEFEIPVFFYEKSERGRHEAELPILRKRGFGGLAELGFVPDYGPMRAHSRLGVCVVGARDFLVAMNAELNVAEPALAKKIAQQARELRRSGDPRFLGVRALGFPLASVGRSQVSFNLTLPDLTPIDPILDYVRREAAMQGVSVFRNELIGVIRSQDMAQAGTLPVRPCQVVDR